MIKRKYLLTWQKAIRRTAPTSNSAFQGGVHLGMTVAYCSPPSLGPKDLVLRINECNRDLSPVDTYHPKVPLLQHTQLT